MPGRATSRPTGRPTSHRNEVLLVGRVAAPAIERALPSGDVLLAWRLVVARRPTGGRGPVVDTLDCVALRPELRRRAAAWQGGETVEVRGALRRRFFRSAQGPASRYQVEVAALRRADRDG